MSWSLGDGNCCKFWTDPWLDGASISELAPALTALVPCRIGNRRLACYALPQHAWIRDIRGALGPAVTVEYVDIWRRLQGISLVPRPDIIRWHWIDNGAYTAKSCYRALFQGATQAPFWHLIWKNGAPMGFKIFLSLTGLDRCWTDARLARHGLPHSTACILCDQDEEWMHHLLIECVFSRIICHDTLHWCRLTIRPPDGTISFFEWWSLAVQSSTPCRRKGIGTLVALIAWAIWKHRNALRLRRSHAITFPPGPRYPGGCSHLG